MSLAFHMKGCGKVINTRCMHGYGTCFSEDFVALERTFQEVFPMSKYKKEWLDARAILCEKLGITESEFEQMLSLAHCYHDK